MYNILNTFEEAGTISEEGWQELQEVLSESVADAFKIKTYQKKTFKVLSNPSGKMLWPSGKDVGR